STATTAVTAREVEEEEEDMTMKVMLLQLSDATVSAFNLAFLMIMKAAAAS
ncbi:hypothetical protein BDDG_13690, partial [Blastomyces dermatitidis ATCC 18188]